MKRFEGFFLTLQYQKRLKLQCTGVFLYEKLIKYQKNNLH